MDSPRRAALLFAGTPREILARIVPGDPLGVRPRLAGALRRRALLLEGDRAFLRVLANCAREAIGWRGRPPLETWLEERIEEALDELLAEEAEGADPPGTRNPRGVFATIAGPLGLDPLALARGCRLFHRRPAQEREAFFLLVLEGRGLRASSSALGLSAPACARAARRALDVFLTAPPSASPLLET